MLSVRSAVSADITKLAARDYSFLVRAVAVEPFDDLDHTVPVEAPYDKSYGFDGDELHGYLDGDGLALFVAEAAAGPVAYAAVSRGWNGYAVVDDIAVDAAHRGGGTGRRLMDAVVGWARLEMLEGVRLETQSNNLAACRFYRRYGFVLGGYDRYLYTPLHPGTNEVALFWYLRFSS